MGLPFARLFGNKASSQPGQADAPASPTQTKADPGDAPRTNGGKFFGLKRAAQPKAATLAPDADKANDKLLSAMVSARAYRASEFLEAHTNSAQPSAKLELAAAGLECRENTAQKQGMTFAHSVIQHAVGCYGSLDDASEKFKQEVAQKIDELIKEFEPVPGKSEIPKAETILEMVNKAFPHARLSVRVIDGDNGKDNLKRIIDTNLEHSVMSHSNEVLLFYKNNRFEAIVADSNKLSVSPTPESRSAVPPDYSENIARAAYAGTEIQSFLNLKKSRKREQPNFSAEFRKEKTQEPVLNDALKPLNIERIANDVPGEISLVTGLLRLATGMHEKSGLPLHMGSITDAESLHALEAREILQQLDAYPNPNKHGGPAGLPQNDPRVSQIIDVINQRYDVKLNVMLVEADEAGLHKTAMYSAESGGNKLTSKSAPPAAEADDNTPKLDHDDPSATTIVLLRNGNTFEPLRRSAVKTNPLLQPALRNAQKSFYGKVKAKTADVISLGRRNKVRKMSDDQLELRSKTHGAAIQQAMQNELGKRQNADRIDIGIQTLNERRKLRFRHVPLENNRYAKKSAEELIAKLNPPDVRDRKSPQKERLAKLALYQIRIAENHPNATQPLPPILKPLASEVKIAEMGMCFKRLLQAVDPDAMTKKWVSEAYTPTAEVAKPWKDNELCQIEKLVLGAQTAARKGLTNGNIFNLKKAKDCLAAAKQGLANARKPTNPSAPVDKAFIEAGSDIDKLSDSLDHIINGQSADPESAAFKAFKARQQRELGISPGAIVALDQIVALKSKAMHQQSELQDIVRKALQTPGILDSLKNADTTLTHESTVAQVLEAYQLATATIEEKTQNHQSGVDDVDLMHKTLEGIHDAITSALAPDPDPAQIGKLQIAKVTADLCSILKHLEIKLPIAENPAVAAILKRLEGLPFIDWKPVENNPSKGIFAFPPETLMTLQPVIEGMKDAAVSTQCSIERTTDAFTGLHQTLRNAFLGFETRYRDNEILHGRIAALEKLEATYAEDRKAASNELQRQANVAVLKRVMNREAGITHREASTT